MLATIENPTPLIWLPLAMACGYFAMAAWMDFKERDKPGGVWHSILFVAMLVASYAALSGCTQAAAQCVPAANPRADVNTNGEVGPDDLLVIRSGENWGLPVECPPTVNDPLTIDIGPTQATVTLTLDHSPGVGKKVWSITVPRSQVIQGRTLVGNWKKTAINANQDTLIINCTIRRWQTGVGSGDPNVKVWIVNSTIEDCKGYGAYLPGTGVAVIGSTIRNIGGTCLRLPHYKGAVVFDTVIEDSGRRLLLKAHSATRLAPYSSGLWVEKCRFIGGPHGDFLVTAAPQNPKMTEDVRDVTFLDCSFTASPDTRNALLIASQNAVIRRCSFDLSPSKLGERFGIACEKQGASKFGPVLIEGCTSVGATQTVRDTKRFPLPSGVIVR